VSKKFREKFPLRNSVARATSIEVPCGPNECGPATQQTMPRRRTPGMPPRSLLVLPPEGVVPGPRATSFFFLSATFFF
jgi:hypothetical protein